jgi:hypothetical protein
MANPNIQIDDEVREMTADEYADYLKVTSETQKNLGK